MIVWGGFGDGNLHTGGRYIASSSTEQSMHVGDLDARAKSQPLRWLAEVMVAVHDGAESPVDGATVSVDINARTRSCTTTAAGTCNVRLRVPHEIETLTITVTSITKEGFGYDPVANHDPEGDSDGTTIVIVHPPT